MSKYYRNQHGTVVHYAYCTKVTPKSKPWLWADWKSDSLIALYMSENGVAPCRLCRPPLWPEGRSGAPMLRIIR